MPAFSSGQFEEALRQLAVVPSRKKLASIASALRRAPKEQREVISAPFVADHLAAVVQACGSASVAAILNDPWIDAAYKSATRGVALGPPDEADTKATKRFLSGLGHSFDVPPEMAPGPLHPGDIVDALDQTTPTAFRWAVLVLGALQEYHLEPDAPRRWAEVYKNVQGLEQRIQNGAAALRDLTALSETLHPPSHYQVAQQHTDRAVSASVERRTLIAMRKPLRYISDALPPQFRLDETASVRLLIYRLCIANRYAFRATKPAAIELFLQARGVRPLDSRNVNRAIRANSPYPSAKGGIEYRRILIASRDKSAWAKD
ncbi:hypothetical protein [Achromobacter insuavis]|uniref:hypothetical protein n=1 Tax=Achromobacter insuavis TaxID=1287735 RepID=UPI001F12DDE2|nr:hypothetical protein [Achromobacter insuavis]